MHITQTVNELPMVSVDLVRAWQRSDNKIEGWTEQIAEQAERRYRRFLLMISVNPGQAYAPTLDIDVMWHLHMLAPRAYVTDCHRLFGEILDHDGGFGKTADEEQLLRQVHDRTAAMWTALFDEPYQVEPTDGLTKCWHDCKSRCWHACKSAGNVLLGDARDMAAMTRA